MSVASSSYYPAECSGCGKKSLAKTASPLLQSWKQEFVSTRDNLIKQINSGKMSLGEMAAFDARPKGYSQEAWKSVGILSDCCKLEILSYLPYDEHLRNYNDADSIVPPDMIEMVEWTSMQSENAQPLTVHTTGTRLQYSS